MNAQLWRRIAMASSMAILFGLTCIGGALAHCGPSAQVSTTVPTKVDESYPAGYSRDSSDTGRVQRGPEDSAIPPIAKFPNANNYWIATSYNTDGYTADRAIEYLVDKGVNRHLATAFAAAYGQALSDSITARSLTGRYVDEFLLSGFDAASENALDAKLSEVMNRLGIPTQSKAASLSDGAGYRYVTAHALRGANRNILTDLNTAVMK